MTMQPRWRATTCETFPSTPLLESMPDLPMALSLLWPPWSVNCWRAEYIFPWPLQSEVVWQSMRSRSCMIHVVESVDRVDDLSFPEPATEGCGLTCLRRNVPSSGRNSIGRLRSTLEDGQLSNFFSRPCLQAPLLSSLPTVLFGAPLRAPLPCYSIGRGVRGCTFWHSAGTVEWQCHLRAQSADTKQRQTAFGSEKKDARTQQARDHSAWITASHGALLPLVVSPMRHARGRLFFRSHDRPSQFLTFKSDIMECKRLKAGE